MIRSDLLIPGGIAADRTEDIPADDVLHLLIDPPVDGCLPEHPVDITVIMDVVDASAEIIDIPLVCNRMRSCEDKIRCGHRFGELTQHSVKIVVQKLILISVVFIEGGAVDQSLAAQHIDCDLSEFIFFKTLQKRLVDMPECFDNARICFAHGNDSPRGVDSGQIYV